MNFLFKKTAPFLVFSIPSYPIQPCCASVAQRFLEDEESTEEKLENLVLQVAVSANIFKLITDWISTRADK